MYLDAIINTINKLVSNNSSYKLDYTKLSFYLDSAVDTINQTLDTEYLTIQESFDLESVAFKAAHPIALLASWPFISYTQFDDKYIRQILIYYTAAFYLEEEDETEEQYQLFKTRADTALYKWRQTDYSCLDITDSSYPYPVLQEYKDHLQNVDTFSTELEALLVSYRAAIVSYTAKIAVLDVLIAAATDATLITRYTAEKERYELIIADYEAVLGEENV